MLPDSSSITAPSLLRKHTRSKGPFLHRHYPASAVVWPSPTPRRTVALSSDVWGRDPQPVPSLPLYPQIPFPACRAHYPGGPNRCRWLLLWRAPTPGPSLFVRPSPYLRRVGVHTFTFEACSSFTRVTACRVAHPPFRGLYHEASPWSVSRLGCSQTIQSYQQLLEWVLPPLAICAVEAH